MRLDHATWPEVEAYLRRSPGIIVPTGSTEQHGPMGVIGTDALCAEQVALAAAAKVDALVAPTLAYAPAPFNTLFPGTVSISESLFEALATEIVEGLSAQGLTRVYVVNGHGANLAPLNRIAERVGVASMRVRSWWEFPPVNALRHELYGDWEGMHATPSEIAITQATHRIVPPGAAAQPPEQLSRAYIQQHAGDKHGPPDQHRARFPDGRVGSHSALAQPAHGTALLHAAAAAVAQDYASFIAATGP